MAKPFKLARIGGAPGAAALVHGILAAMVSGSGRAGEPFEVDLALAYTGPDVATTLAYAGLLGRQTGAPLTARAVPLDEALDEADLVLCAETPTTAHQHLSEVYAAVGWVPPAFGPGAVAEACAVGPSFLEWARQAAARCPGAPLVTVAPPVDVLAGAARRRYGITGLRTVGLSGEVDILRGRLAALLNTPEEQILLVHGGVDRVGWVVRFAVGGRDGYGDFGDQIQRWLGAPHQPSTDHLIPEIYDLTGMIRTSARQVWPFVFGSVADADPGVPEPAARTQADEGALMAAAVAEGHARVEPLVARPGSAAEEEIRIGRAVGRMVRAMATGELAVVSLQVPYSGDTLGWSPEITVEVPSVVGGPQIEPMAVGPLPAGVDGLPRLLGQQRALASDYLAAPDVSVLRRAFATTPQWGRVDQIRALTAALHEAFAPQLEAAARGG